MGDSGETSLSFKVIFELLLDFLKNCIVSILIGIAIALIATYISKIFCCFMEDAIKVNIYLLLVGYASYCVGELSDVSSVIAVLTT